MTSNLRCSICAWYQWHKTVTSHVFMCCVLHSGAHLVSSTVCWSWIQILLSRKKNWIVSYKLYSISWAKISSKQIFTFLATALPDFSTGMKGIRGSQVESFCNMYGNLLPHKSIYLLWVWKLCDKAGCESQTAECTVAEFTFGKHRAWTTSYTAHTQQWF